jgi:thioredoxin-related protein
MKSLYNIQSYPTWIFLDANGNLIETSSGYTEELIEERLALVKKLYDSN